MADNIDATPNMPVASSSVGSNQQAVKIPTPDLVIFDQESQKIDALTNLIFEDIGGQELINLVRHDTILGKNLRYRPVSNLQQIAYAYNANNIFTVSGTLDKFFKNFAIRLDIHTVEPGSGTGPGGSRLYIDNLNQNPNQSGRLVLDVTNMEVNEQVDIQVLNMGNYLDGIINTEDSP